MPKTRRKSEENRLFQKTRIQTILDKSPWDSTAIFIFFCYLSVPSLNTSAFAKFSCSSPSPHPIQSWNSEKILDTLVQHCWWGEGRGWTCVNWKTPKKCKCVPRLVSMIVGLTMGSVRFSLYLLLVICVYRSNAHGSLPTDVPPALIQTTVTRTFAKPAVNLSRVNQPKGPV